MMFTIGGEGEGRLDILQAEFGVIREDLLVAHAGSKPSEHIINRDAHVTDTWSATTFSGFNGDAATVIFHVGNLGFGAALARAEVEGQ